MNSKIQTQRNGSSSRKFVRACLASCEKLVAQIQRTKDALLAEFRETRAAHEQLLRLALTEAEALAWQTPYPQLVFPSLAREKAEAVVSWQTRQHAIRQTLIPLSLAA